MKKITIIIASVLVTSAVAFAQKTKQADVPAVVKEAFAKKYPAVKVEKWEKEGADFEAEFDLNKTESSAVFSGDGAFKELEQEIKVGELPAAVRDYCSKAFAGYRLSEAAKITEASGNVMYEAEMSKNKEHFDAIFDAQGKFIKKSDTSTKEDKKD